MTIIIALNTSLYAQEFPVKIYNIKNGLPFQEVFGVNQDLDGMMWFSSRSALITYDGAEWNTIPYPRSNTAGHYNKLYFEENGDVWLYTWGREVFKWDGKQWHTLFHYDVQVVDNYYTYYDMVKWGGENYVFLTRRGITEFFNGNEWVPFEFPEKTEIKATFTMGDTLVFYAKNRFYSLHNFEWVRSSLSHLDLENKNIDYVYYEKATASSEAKLWYAGQNSVGHFENGKDVILRSIDSGFRNSHQIRWTGVIPDGIGGIVASSANHIFRIDEKGNLATFDILSGLKTYGATSLFIDREKNVWVACTRGLNKIRNFNFHNYRKIHGLIQDEVSSIAIVKDKIYFGQYSGITLLKNNELIQFPIKELHREDFRNNVRIMHILPHREQEDVVWISTDLKGLYKFSEMDGYTYLGVPNNAVNSSTMLQLDDGNLLIGSSKGVHKFDVKSETFSRIYPEINDYVRSMMYLSNGDILITARHFGVYVISNGQVKNFRSGENKRANGTFNSIEYQGDVLIGTDDGLYYLNGDVLSPYSINGEHIHEPIYTFIKNRDELWIGGNNGVYHWAKDQLRFFTVNDGLAGSECNRKAGAIDSEGNVWIGTSEGVSKITGQFDNIGALNIQPEIISLKVNDITYDPKEFEKTSHTHNNISFNIRYLAYKNEDTVLFEYSLLNLGNGDKSQFVSESQTAHFLSLEPGSYRFEVKARYGNNPWSEPVSSNEFTITKPFVQTTLFNAIVFIITLGITLLLIRLFLQRRIVKSLASRVMEAEEKTATIVSTTKTLMLQVDHLGKIKYLSPGIRNALGYEKISIRNRNYIDFIHPEDRVKVYRRGMMVLRDRNSQQDFQVRLRTKKDDYVWYHVTVSPTKNDGKIWANVIGQVIDKQKHLEEQLRHAQKLEAVGRLAGGVAHDFNNLLTAIRGYTELALLEIEEENVIESYLNEVENTVDRASNLTSQLLAFSRKQNLKFEYLDVNIVLNDMMGMLKSLLGEDIKLDVKTQKHLWTVRADVGQLEQVIINLTVNARDAMQKNGIVKIRTKNIKREDDAGFIHEYVRLSIEDNGSGIPKDVQERVFEPFFTTKPKGKGTGLGLSTVYGIIKQCDGILEFESETSKGTTFNIFFPKRDHVAENMLFKATRKITKERNGSAKVLVVEDEEAVMKFTKRVLEKSGFIVFAASSGVEALEVVKDQDDLDLVLTDVIMPGMSGPELSNILHMKWPGMKVVFMSGYPAQHFEENGINLKEMPLIKKPFKSKDLSDTLRKVLDR